MKWKTLEHNGILFPPPFESQGIKIKIKGEKIDLDLLQEEMVYQWEKKKDTPYVQDRVFQKNFVSDFAKTLPVKFKNISYSDIDFSDAYKIVDKEKDSREGMTKEAKKSLAAKRKKLREDMKEKYGKAIMDGKEVEVANYMAEPPGIFIGRGDHPIRGRWKPRVTPKDVTLNLGKDAKVPPGNWGTIIHNQDFMWLASWMDVLTQKRKYVWLADTAGLKQERDQEKYDKAVKLSKEIEKIKEKMVKNLKSNDPKIRRIATACYLIYRTAMRVGDEKQFYDNLKELIKNKKPKDEIFHGITSRHVNAFFSGIVNGLTAKVFRTYLATNVVKEYLKKHNNIKSKSENEKLYHAKLANLEAAMMCNHKRTIPKTFEDALQKKKEMLKKLDSTQPKTEKQKEALKERKEKIGLAIDLAGKTRDYNLGTSLRNYIDPRVFKAWTDEVKADWEKLYTAALQKKFLWVKNVDADWKKIA